MNTRIPPSIVSSSAVLGLALLLGACTDPSSPDVAELEANDEQDPFYELVAGDYPYRDGDMTVCSVWEADLGDEVVQRREIYIIERMNSELDEDPQWREFLGQSRVATCDEARDYQVARRAYEATLPVEPKRMRGPFPAEPGLEQVDKIGEADGESDNNAVVRIKLTAGSSSGCSGTLINPRVVLTAAHCFSQGYRSFALRREEDGVVQNFVTQNAQFHRHIDYTGVGDPGDDIGLMVFDDPIPGVNENADMMRVLTSGIDGGDDIVFLGWGIASHDGTGAGVLRYGLATVNWGNSRYFSDIINQGAARLCKQDSGGPARLERASNNLTVDLVGGMASEGDVGSEFCGYPGDEQRWAATEDKIEWIETRFEMHGLNLTPQEASTSCHHYTQSGHDYMKCW